MRSGERARQAEFSAEVRGAQLMAALAASATLAAALGFATAAGLPRVAPSWGTTDRLAAVIVAEVYAAIIVGHLIAFGGWRAARAHLRLRPASAGQIAAACGVWIAGWAAAGLVYVAVSGVLWPLSHVRDAYMWIGADGGRLTSREPLLFLLGAGRAVLLTPVAEEMLFRGSLFGWMRRHVTAPVAIVVSATLFALAHPMPVLLPGAFFFGIGAAWYRERTDSLTPFIVVHMLNSIAFITVSYVFSGWNVVRMF